MAQSHFELIFKQIAFHRNTLHVQEEPTWFQSEL
jgi:hypothetical protein